MGTLFSVVQQYFTGMHYLLWEEHVLSGTTIFHWYTFFPAGSASAATLSRSGQPKMSSVEIMVNMIEAIIMEDQSLTVRELRGLLHNFMSYFSSVTFGSEF